MRQVAAVSSDDARQCLATLVGIHSGRAFLCRIVSQKATNYKLRIDVGE